VSAVHLEYRAAAGVVLLRLSGSVSTSKVVTLLEALRRHPPGMPILADCRQLAMPTSAAVAEIARRLAPPHPYDPAAHAVILASPGLSALGPIVEHYFPGPRTHAVHVCQSWQDAAQALGFSAGELPEASSGSR
jgi:hypothetical protein